MADDNPVGTEPIQEQEPIKTAADLRIEALEARLDELEAKNRELREANAGLWAAAHPVQEAPAPAPAAVSETDIQTLYADLGIKE